MTVQLRVPMRVTLTPVREDQPRYWRIVSYERLPQERVSQYQANHIGRNPAATGEVLLSVVRQYEWVLVGSQWRFLVTRVSEMRRVPGIRVRGEQVREWPRHIDRETGAEVSEAARRAAVMAVRRACHVDPVAGATEPDWDKAKLLAERALDRATNRGNDEVS